MRMKESTEFHSVFDSVFDAEFSYVCRVLQRLGVPHADVEDVAQEVFVTVHAKFGEYDRTKPVRPWLFAFAYRSASNYHRVAHRRESREQVSEAPPPTTPEEGALDRQAQALVLAALQQIPLERRCVLIMHDIDGFSAPEIGETLSIPTNTVYSRVRIAREEFKKAIQREERRR